MSEAATLRAAARDASKPIHEVLCKAQEVAVALKVECPPWIQHELDGYPDISELPRYRHLRASIKVWDGMMWAPVMHPHHQELTDLLKAVPVLQSAATIERIGQTNPPSESHSALPGDLALQLMEHFKRQANFVLATPTSEFARCIDGVRSRLHTWALTLPVPVEAPQPVQPNSTSLSPVAKPDNSLAREASKTAITETIKQVAPELVKAAPKLWPWLLAALSAVAAWLRACQH